MEKSNKIISNIISYLFHPLLMPTYALIIIFNSNTHYSYMPIPAQRLIYILVFSTTFLIPVSIIPFLINLKVISDFQLEKSNERIIPLTITAISYSFSYYILDKLPVSTLGFLKLMILASLILIVINLAITIKWKISAHLIGIGGLLASIFFYGVYFVANFSLLLIIISLIAGLVGYARLNLQVHSPAQVYTGFLTGFICMWLILYFGL
jgi:hypothetical protein